jgi:hypothetical protein
MQESQLLLDEIQAVPKVVHQKGKRICAHASNPGIKMPIRGRGGIEHGYYRDDEAIEMVVENDVFYVPTLVCNLDEEFLRESGMAKMDLLGMGKGAGSDPSDLRLLGPDSGTEQQRQTLLGLYDLPVYEHKHLVVAVQSIPD